MKYIVYKTTNKVNNYIYIGVHKTEDPCIFDGYIGCGVNIKIPYTYEHSKTKFLLAVKEFGTSNFYREVLATFDTPEQAYELEGILVNEDFLSRDDVYNMVIGGIVNKTEGIKVYQYDSNGIYVKEYDSYESAAKVLNVQSSSIRRAVVYKYRVHDYYFNTDKMNQIDLSLYNSNLKIKVYRYFKEGLFDQEFESYNDAAKNSDSSPSNIRLAALTGYCVKNKYYFSFIKDTSYDRARCTQIKTRSVHKYDSEGKYIESYQTQEEAEKKNPHSNITKSIKLKSIDKNGFMWSLEKLDFYNCSKRRIRKVGLFDDNGNLIKTWNSARQCAKEVGSSVQNVLNGKYEKHKGKIYKYIYN